MQLYACDWFSSVAFVLNGKKWKHRCTCNSVKYQVVSIVTLVGLEITVFGPCTVLIKCLIKMNMCKVECWKCVHLNINLYMCVGSFVEIVQVCVANFCVHLF